MEETKRCPKCGEDKVKSEFYYTKGKLSGYCKDCTRVYNRERYHLRKHRRDVADAVH